ncbi:hypothetical protein WOLCODRAFT_161978 [Wolfiporia cocos MD-104 SS10]|uniref:Phosphatidylglycerol/phosphatidylinositol transfer protein n=1 Tax=Wolfiporia cocos (strain MD-104) TaxID=742152 RepID=A0A2H3JCM1_WOLCO|nr:hypothetical protein WOLCODRAFT_161978 [Wolfiporia cocos MD-104 SS10]
MKYLAVLTALAAACYAQTGLVIETNTNGTVSPGQNMTVVVLKPTESAPSIEVAIVIAMTQCPDQDCSSPSFNISQDLERVLYYGPYNPQYSSNRTEPQHQNFTVQVPQTPFESGDKVALSVTRFALDESAAGDSVVVQTPFITMNID